MNKFLRPVDYAAAVLYGSDADLGVGGVQDIGTMSGGIHPCIHYSLRGRLPVGDIFTRSSIRDTEFAHHIEWGPVGRGLVGKIVVVDHVL